MTQGPNHPNRVVFLADRLRWESSGVHGRRFKTRDGEYNRAGVEASAGRREGKPNDIELLSDDDPKGGMTCSVRR